MEKQKGKLIEIQLSEIDWHVIKRVKELRTDKGISQEQLSIRLGLAEGFVSKVENLTERSKYNLRHLNLIVKTLNISYADLLPRNATPNDYIKIRLRRVKRMNKDGTESKRTEVEVVETVPVKTELM